jgi:lipopolysaccharide/colanic/teichoic acid biosynthesis glycosyltransferase
MHTGSFGEDLEVTKDGIMSALRSESQPAGTRRLNTDAHLTLEKRGVSAGRIVLHEDAFVSMLYLERRRAERAQKRFVLMLIDVKNAIADGQKNRTLAKVTSALLNVTRETDIVGWYLEDQLIGVICTEVGKAKPKTVQSRMLEKVKAAFIEALPAEKVSKITLSFHFFPEEVEESGTDHSANITLYPDLSRKEESHKLALGIKRSMDLIGSAAALVLLSPVFAAVSLAIKLTSKGPVLFRQERLGQYGKKFTVLKFRSMLTDCDARIHEEYVSQFIAGQVDGTNQGSDKPVFKIQEDPRVTRLGWFLRRTSLDELPQFWNVMVGNMSLVGPRPPLPYEFKAYDLWHRRRVLEIKPGITGLWQVEGRSRTRFDEMVRLDLKYARAWSIWLDVKILLQTPGAVLTGEGAH